MESKTFVKLLRKVIREEVTLAVRREIRSSLNENKTDHNKVINHGVQLSKMANKKPKKYVKDSMLNDILNNTSPLQESSTMNYNSGMAQSFKSMMTEEPNISHVAPMTDINGKPVNVNDQKVAATVNAMTKDYSALMKAVDKKKGIR
jgi:hypothetical protein